MDFKCGIIGLPNAGKSTLFNAITKAGVKTAKFPFCTIEPNIGSVPIFDLRINKIAEIVKPRRIIPTTMAFVDIAGLVKGASEGKGLGNKFLSHIRDTELICHVVRCFENDAVIHVSENINPEEDIKIVNNELILSDLKTCELAMHKAQKLVRNGNKEAELELLTLEKCFFHLSNASSLRTLKLIESEKKVINHFGFITLKPIMYIANVNENKFSNNSYINKVRKIAIEECSASTTICAELESNIANLKGEYKNFTAAIDDNCNDSKLNKLVKLGHNLLNLQTYFTVGAKEVRARAIQIGANALEAAGKIHSDFKKGFIRAQIISFSDFVFYKGYQGAKKAGKMRLEGKQYLVNDGDIIKILCNI